jgi:hypothetical protein
MRRLNQADLVNTLTSGCNPIPYRDSLFGADYGSSIFICEPANNLVHREVLVPDGISFTSCRADDEQGLEGLEGGGGAQLGHGRALFRGGSDLSALSARRPFDVSRESNRGANAGAGVSVNAR